jgi:hypothetical protein
MGDDDLLRLEAEVRRERRRRALGDQDGCAECGEEDVMCLARTQDREVLCRRCRARKFAPANSGYQGPQPQGDGTRLCQQCPHDRALTSAGANVIERHHALGRAHNQGFIVPLCVNCHSKHTEWQRRLGVDFRPQPNKLATLTAAISSGVAHVMATFDCTRHSPPLFRAMHVLLAAITALAGLSEITKCPTCTGK